MPKKRIPKARFKYNDGGALTIARGIYSVTLGKNDVERLITTLLTPKENPCVCGNRGGTGEWCTC